MISASQLLVLFWGIIAIWLVWIEWSYQRKVRRTAREREQFNKHRKAKGIHIRPSTAIIINDHCEGEDT